MTQRQRSRRVARVLTRLQQIRRPADALEIGAAAIEGEPRAHHVTKDGRESIGLAIAAALARRGLVRATPDNHFVLRVLKIETREDSKRLQREFVAPGEQRD